MSEPGLAGRRDHVFAPSQLAGRSIERDDEITHAAVAAGSTEDDLVLDRQRRRGELQIRLTVVEVGFPRDLAGFLVGRDHARRIVRNRDDEISPQRRAAVRERDLLLARVHAPHDPARLSGTPIDLIEHAPLIDDVEEAVLRQRRRFEVLVRRGTADRDRVGELEVLDVVLVDLVERRVTLRIIGAVVHQPVLRFLSALISRSDVTSAEIAGAVTLRAVAARKMRASVLRQRITFLPNFHNAWTRAAGPRAARRRLACPMAS